MRSGFDIGNVGLLRLLHEPGFSLRGGELATQKVGYQVSSGKTSHKSSIIGPLVGKVSGAFGLCNKLYWGMLDWVLPLFSIEPEAYKSAHQHAEVI